MNKLALIQIKDILNQIGGPLYIDYRSNNINLISRDLIDFHIQKISALISNKLYLEKEYSISDLFSLYMCLEYIINYLGPEEFHAVLGKDIYEDGYQILFHIKSMIVRPCSFED